jgi:uncharacterized membrane protein YfcA
VELLVFLGGAFLVAFAVGASGFADALIASAIWLHIYPAHEAVPLIYLCGALVHALSLVALRNALNPGRLAPFVLGGMCGTPVGVWVLQVLDPEPIKRGVGAVLIVLASWQLAGFARAKARPSSERLHADSWPLRVADGGVGAVGGLLGGLAGLSGVLPTLWVGARGWTPSVQRGVYQPFILLMHVWALCALWVASAFPDVVMERFLYCIPVLLAGLVLGQSVYRRINQRVFRVCVLALLCVSGVALVA